MTFDIALSRPLGALLVAGGVVLLGGLAIATALANLETATDERDAKTAFVARSLAADRVEMGHGEATTPDRNLAVVAESDTLAAADVDALVRGTVEKAGGTVLSSRAEAKHNEPSGAGASERIEVQAVIQGRMEALQASLVELESGRPLIMVEAVSVHPSEASDKGAPALETPVLTATLTLSAYWSLPKPGALSQ